jgi:MFS family permease
MQVSQKSSKPKSGIQLSLIDALLFALMVGLGETYFSAFAAAGKLNHILVGLVASLPLLTGATLQLMSPWCLRRFRSYKNWVVLSAFTQALAFIPLIFSGLFENLSFILILISTSIYWGAGFAASPSWNSWMTHLIPKNERAPYISKRLRITQYGIVVGLCLGGIALQLTKKSNNLHMFAFLFLIAAGSRLISALTLMKMPFKAAWFSELPMPSLRKAISDVQKDFRDKNKFSSLFIFLFIFYITIFISSPFVIPFLLLQLKYSWFEFMMAQLALFAGKIWFLPIAKNLIEKKGVRFAFVFGAAGIAPLPALWPLCHNFLPAVLLQFVSGIFWSSFEASLALIFLDRLNPEHKTATLSLYNFINALAIVVGSLIGGQLLYWWGENSSSYHSIFIGGATLRVLAVVPLLQFPEVWIQKVPSIFRILLPREGVDTLRFLNDDSNNDSNNGTEAGDKI